MDTPSHARELEVTRSRDFSRRRPRVTSEVDLEPGRGCMLVDVRVTVWAADEHDYDQFVLVVLPRLHEVFADFATDHELGRRRPG